MVVVIYLYYLSFLFWGILVSAVGKDDIHRNARRRRRIHTYSNPTSVMSKCMNYISCMVVKTRVASSTEGKIIIYRICKYKMIIDERCHNCTVYVVLINSKKWTLASLDVKSKKIN